MTDGNELKAYYHECMPLFIAMGDEVRLNIIEILTHALATDRKEGLNVNEITRQMQLSRPAVSHHLKILKDAGLVEVRRSGTSNYYRLTMSDCTQRLMKLGRMSESFYGAY
jgi:DNA-binding transcriptional ArsR family regulator